MVLNQDLSRHRWLRRRGHGFGRNDQLGSISIGRTYSRSDRRAESGSHGVCIRQGYGFLKHNSSLLPLCPMCGYLPSFSAPTLYILLQAKETEFRHSSIQDIFLGCCHSGALPVYPAGIVLGKGQSDGCS